jgi:predicted dehydrogenase
MRELQVALIGGSGFMGYAHSHAYPLVTIDQDLGASIRKKVLVDVDAPRAADAARQFGWEESASDWRAVVQRSDIDIVDIVTPPDTHEEIAVAALEAGKHVICEKPIANDAAAAERMWLAAKKAGVVTQVAHNYRHTPAIAYIRQLLDDGTLGKPLQLRISYMSEGGFGGPMFGWRGYRKSGGSGMSGDLGSHIIDAALYLMGDIRRVSGRLVQNGAILPGSRLRGDDELDDAGLFLAEFADGGLGSFAFGVQSWRNYNHMAFELDATEGAVEFDWNQRDQFRLALASDTGPTAGFRTVHLGSGHPDPWWRVTGLGTGYLEPGVAQLRKFVQAIVTGGNSHPNFGDALHTQQVVDAVVESNVSGEWINVAPRDPDALN